MSPRFLKIVPWLYQWEGKTYENDPDDPGGATKFGIDQRSHPNENIHSLTEDRATEIYWIEYWQKHHCEDYPFPFGEVLFNCCVNAGYGRSQKILATGAKTAAQFLDEQDRFYDRLAEARPTSRKYLRGWKNRTRSLRQFLKIT